MTLRIRFQYIRFGEIAFAKDFLRGTRSLSKWWFLEMDRFRAKKKLFFCIPKHIRQLATGYQSPNHYREERTDTNESVPSH